MCNGPVYSSARCLRSQGSVYMGGFVVVGGGGRSKRGGGGLQPSEIAPSHFIAPFYSADAVNIYGVGAVPTTE